MRIAFASCFCTKVFADQPVWDWIRMKAPDHLVLLGDTIYLDVPVVNKHPKEMGDDEFAQHLHALYTEVVQQAQFVKLLQSMPAGRAWSIWDDHDFLWNDALGAFDGLNPEHVGKVRLSTAFQEAFRRALAASLADGAFPAAYNDHVFWQLTQPPLSTPSIQLDEGLWLHLADVRSYRTQSWLVGEAHRTMLGAAQRASFQKAMAAQPQAIHLFASGSTLADYKKRYPKDWRWLLDQAKVRRTLVLSGDIHRNESDAFFTGGLPLHEATSSGAAVRDAVAFGKRRRNFGLLDIDANHVTISLFADNKLEKKWSRKLDKASWLPV